MGSGFVSRMVTYGEGLTGLLVHAARAVAPMPAVVVIQEAWGLDEHIEDVAGRVARAGYVALAPDLPSHHGVRPEVMSRARVDEVKAFLDTVPIDRRNPPGIQAAIDALVGEEQARIRASVAAIFGQLGALDAYGPALVAAARYLRTDCELSRGQKVASVGFCMGGALSARLAAGDPELAGAAIFYGSSPPPEQAERIRCPILGLYAEGDDRINQGVPAFVASLTARGVPVERHEYPGARHAFFNDTRSAYHAAASRDAWRRLLQFFAATAGG